MTSRVSILGTGLLGASVGLALRKAGFQGRIIGWNRSADGGETALRMGAVDALATDPIEAAREAEITVLAVPIFATLDLMERLATQLDDEHLVTDVGSTKLKITQAGAEH